MNKKLLFLILLMIPQVAFAAIAGLVSHIEGDVFRQGNQKLKPGTTETIDSMDTLHSQIGSRLVVALRDGSQLILFENSSLQLALNQSDGSDRIRLLQGDCWLLILQSDQPYAVQVADLTIASRNAALLISYNASERSGFVTIGNGSATISPSQSDHVYSAGTRMTVAGGKLNRITTVKEQIELRSSLTDYKLTQAGQLPVIVRVTLPIGYSVRNPVPAFVIGASPNLSVKTPAFRLDQEATEIEVTALGPGVSDLYVVTETFDGKPALAGVVSISVKPTADYKNMKIKTARGDILIKLAPVQK